MVFAIPWENALMVPGVGTIAHLIGALAGVLGVLAIIERQSVRLPSPGHVLITLFVLWAAASYLWTLDPEETLLAAGSFLQLFMMVWLIWELASREGEQRRLMQAYVLGTYVSGIDTVYRYFFNLESELMNRYASTGFNPNDLALVMALSIPLSYYLAIQSEGLMGWVYRVQLVLAGTTILLTASRDGLLASLVAVTIVPLTFARLTRLQKIANILTVAVLVCSGLFFVPSTSWERLSTIPKELTQGTLNARRLVWEAGREVFRVHPFQGVGAGAFRESVSRSLGVPMVAHNTFLSVLVEEGVIGFGLFCALMGVLGVSACQMPPLARRLWIVTLGVWVVGVCGASWEMQKPTWLFFALLIGQWASMVQKRPTRGQAQSLAAH
jgi:O-antigen ligase